MKDKMMKAMTDAMPGWDVEIKGPCVVARWNEFVLVFDHYQGRFKAYYREAFGNPIQWLTHQHTEGDDLQDVVDRAVSKVFTSVRHGLDG